AGPRPRCIADRRSQSCHCRYQRSNVDRESARLGECGARRDRGIDASGAACGASPGRTDGALMAARVVMTLSDLEVAVPLDRALMAAGVTCSLVGRASCR